MSRRLPELFSLRQWAALADYCSLTPRQREVARLVCLGLTNDQIAAKLAIAPHTVRMHKQALFERLKIKDRMGVPVRLILAHRRLTK